MFCSVRLTNLNETKAVHQVQVQGLAKQLGPSNMRLTRTCVLVLACLVLLAGTAMGEESDGEYGHHGGKHEKDAECAALSDDSTACEAKKGCAFVIEEDESYCYFKGRGGKGKHDCDDDDEDDCKKHGKHHGKKRGRKGKNQWSLETVLLVAISSGVAVLSAIGLCVYWRRRVSPAVTAGDGGFAPSVPQSSDVKTHQSAQTQAWPAKAELGMVADVEMAYPGVAALQAVADADSRPSSAKPLA